MSEIAINLLNQPELTLNEIRISDKDRVSKKTKKEEKKNKK